MNSEQRKEYKECDLAAKGAIEKYFRRFVFTDRTVWHIDIDEKYERGADHSPPDIFIKHKDFPWTFYVEAMMRKQWPGKEGWPKNYINIHIEARKQKMVQEYAPLMFFLISGDRTHGMIVQGRVVKPMTPIWTFTRWNAQGEREYELNYVVPLEHGRMVNLETGKVVEKWH